MATQQDNPDAKKKSQAADAENETDAALVPAAGATGVGETGEAVEFEGAAPTQLGTDRYVHAAFLAFGLLIAFLLGKILDGIWGLLSTVPSVVRAVPALLQYAEDERGTYTLLAGALIALFMLIYIWRRPDIRKWADEVANELYKVHWPDRDTVTNGTIVVLAGGVFATIYVGLLDRLWSFITNLVYGI